VLTINSNRHSCKQFTCNFSGDCSFIKLILNSKFPANGRLRSQQGVKKHVLKEAEYLFSGYMTWNIYSVNSIAYQYSENLIFKWLKFRQNIVFRHPGSQPSIIYWLLDQVGRFVRLVTFLVRVLGIISLFYRCLNLVKEEGKFILFLKYLDLAKERNSLKN